MFEKVKSLFVGRAKSTVAPASQGLSAGYLPSNLNNVLAYKNGSYDNNYANITRIAEAIAEVTPYAIDKRGERLKTQPKLMEVLASPNQEMSGVDFIETLTVMMLVHPTVFLLAWHQDGKTLVPGGKISPENISGFTFLENASCSIVGGKSTYYGADGHQWTDQDVLSLSLNVNPYDLSKGYSPSLATKKWATVDDYVAEYQSGFFRNGAVPAGQFVITAPSIDDYNRTVDELQRHHRGASNANNVVYVHRPTSSVDGKPMAAQVEWVPYTQNTQDTALQALFDQANKKIDMNFGVPQEVKGYLENSNYASAEVADYVFSRRVVYPKLIKIWAKFTHEMNRLTGGLGYSISFDYEPPALTDTRKVQADTLKILLDAGFTVESAVDALQLPASFKELVKDDGDEEPPVIAEVPEITIDEETTPSSDAEVPKTVTKTKTLETEESPITINEELLNTFTRYFNWQFGELIAMITADPDTDLEAMRSQLEENDNRELLISLLIALLIYITITAGSEAAERFASELGLSGVDFTLSQETNAMITSRVRELLSNFDQESMLKVLEIARQAKDEGWDQATLTKALIELSIRERYRIERWVDSEQYNAEGWGELEAAVLVAVMAGLRPYKTWHTRPNPNRCAECLKMEGETVPADSKYSNGLEIAHLHPHCYCYDEYSFRIPLKSVKVTCPNCGRYMCESTGGNIKGIICANSKCKRRYDIEVANGKIKAVEVAKEEVG